MQRCRPAERRHPLSHKLLVEPEGRDCPVSHHHPHEPPNNHVTLSDHRSRHPAVHAALLPLREPASAQPGYRVSAGLLQRGAGGAGAAADGGAADGSRHPAAQRLKTQHRPLSFYKFALSVIHSL